MIALTLTLFLAAAADEAAPPAAVTPTTPADAAPVDAWEVARLRAPWTEPSGQGVSFGYDNGAWNGLFMQGVRVRFPIFRSFGVVARAVYVHETTAAGYRGNLAPRLELYGATPVYLNLMRIYGGGGVQCFFQVGPAGDGGKPHFGGGGHFGFEFFASRRMSFFIEIGGQGGDILSGATILAGMNLYPFY